MSPRYAVYFAPAADTVLHRIGSRWLGRDALSGTDLDQPAVPGMTPETLSRLTGDPRRYGFHATLKAPFRLAPGQTEAALLAAAEAVAQGHSAFTAPALVLSDLAGFRALVLGAPSPAMAALERDCVATLEPLRAPLTAAERARRRPERLTDRQRRLLDTVGYPYSLAEFRFHLTLTQRLTSDQAVLIDPVLTRVTEPVCGCPWPVDAISVFRQDGDGAPFLQQARLPLQSAGADHPIAEPV